VESKSGRIRHVKDWESIADNLSKAGFSWGCSSDIDPTGRVISLQTHTLAMVAGSPFCQTKGSARFWNLSEATDVASPLQRRVRRPLLWGVSTPSGNGAPSESEGPTPLVV
jgi:hypothetical protein